MPRMPSRRWRWSRPAKPRPTARWWRCWATAPTAAGETRAEFAEAGRTLIAKVPDLQNQGYFAKTDFHDRSGSWHVSPARTSNNQ